MYRTLLGIIGGISLLLVLVGLSFSATVGREAEFRFINGTEPETLDPALMTGSIEGRIGNAVFEGLTRREAKTMRPAPGVAERWTVSEDQTRYTFHLREDARWSDGVELTAHDFVYSWRRLLSPELGADYAYILHMVRYAEAYNTFGPRSEQLAKDLPVALQSWLAEQPDRIGAKAWQRFLAEHHADEALKDTQSEAWSRLMRVRSGTIARADVEAALSALKAEAQRLKRAHVEARKHFGTDGGVWARDDHTLVVELVAPTPYFLEITSFYPTFPVPRHVVEAHPRDWFLPRHVVTNGPFQIESWRVNDRIRMVRSPTYWGKDQVALDTVEALSLENNTTALNLYLTGEVDWLPGLYPPDLVDQLRGRPDFHSNPGLIVYFYRFNTTKPPFDDPRVRQAITLAIDRELIVERVLRLGQLPARTFVPPGIPGYEPPQSAIAFDVERAQDLLAEAGFPGGRGFPKFGILYNTSEAHKQVAEVVADQLRRHLGIQVTPYNQEWQSFLSTVRSVDYDMARAGWIGDYVDPNTFLDMWVTNGGNNRTGFSSPVYDALIAAAANVDAFLQEPGGILEDLKDGNAVRAAMSAIPELDTARERAEKKAELRLLLLREAEAILVQEAFPICPVYFYVVSNLVSPRVEGFHSTLQFPDGATGPNLQNLHPLRDIRVRETRGARP